MEYELVLYRMLIESFRFEEEYDYESEIFLIQSCARAWTSVIFVEKRDSRRHSTTVSSDNAVVAGSSYQMYHKVLSFSCRERA